jgi:hypothetical protein
VLARSAIGLRSSLVPLRLRLLERVGGALGFSPEGRPVRVWTEGRPGEEESRIQEGTVVEVADGGALVELDEPVTADGRELRRVLLVPRERGWGLRALWFSFIAVDAFPAHREGERLGRWWMRLGRSR